MKYFAIFILLFLCLYCEANSNSVCQEYDEKTRSLNQNCGNCTATTLTIDASTVENLKFHNCDSAEVLNTTKLYPNIRVLDISDSNYNSIDWLNIPLSNLKVFNASNNRIENITSLLQNAPHVTNIDFSHNALRTITIDSFGTLNELIDINLSHNMLQHINSDGFTKISTSLEHIDLSNNSLVGIPELPTCQKLRILHLEMNIIKNFTCQRIPWRDTLSAIYLSWSYVERFDGSPEDCKQFRVKLDSDEEAILRTINGSIVTYELQCNDHSFRNLRSFRAGRNVFHNVDTLFETFDVVLNELDVSGNTIDKLDQMDLKRFRNLQKLALSDTQLYTFNLDMIGDAQNLQSLDISNNNLTQLQSLITLKKFRQLNELNISGNQFQHDTILQILNYLSSNVEVLDFSDSHVGKLYNGTFDNPRSTGGYSKLKILNLRNTHLSFADYENPFEKFAQLHTLDVSNNNLSDVNFRILSDTLIKLHTFEAANCELKNPLNILQYFGHSLKRLNLAGNHIGGGNINGFTFQTLITLSHLNLSATDLHEFDLKTITQQEWLTTLDISHNQLQRIDLHELSHFEYLKSLYLNNNELKKLDRFKPNASPALALARNRLPCLYLKQLKHDQPNLKYIGNQLDQKHGEDCLSSTQAIGDFLESVYDTVKFW